MQQNPDIRATVIIPTYGHAPYIRSAIASARAQTVEELEICVILDGSPPEMQERVQGMADDDPRIRIFSFPKAPRTGEVHRAAVIAQTSGPVICYLSHDDLWYPQHVERMESLLATVDFGHSIHVGARLGPELGSIMRARPGNLASPRYRESMVNRHPSPVLFGLTCTAHTRKAYGMLDEGWATTPDGVSTDLHMWRKFLGNPAIRAATHPEVTSLHFPKPYWSSLYGPDEMAEVLAEAWEAVRDPLFREGIANRTAAFFMEQETDLCGLVSAELQTRLSGWMEQDMATVLREVVRDELRERGGNGWLRRVFRFLGKAGG